MHVTNAHQMRTDTAAVATHLRRFTLSGKWDFVLIKLLRSKLHKYSLSRSGLLAVHLISQHSKDKRAPALPSAVPPAGVLPAHVTCAPRVSVRRSWGH